MTHKSSNGNSPASCVHPTGIDPSLWYDARQFCRILNVAVQRRQKFQNAIRDQAETIANGHSMVFLGRVGIDTLREIHTKNNRTREALDE
ncbi:MAG: hypothetical protein WD066_15280 [Planctomycetaceae bacterium]